MTSTSANRSEPAQEVKVSSSVGVDVSPGKILNLPPFGNAVGEGRKLVSTSPTPTASTSSTSSNSSPLSFSASKSDMDDNVSPTAADIEDSEAVKAAHHIRSLSAQFYDATSLSSATSQQAREALQGQGATGQGTYQDQTSNTKRWFRTSNGFAVTEQRNVGTGLCPIAPKPQQRRPVGRKHRRVFSGNFSSVGSIHRRINSGGSTIVIPRYPPGHHRENSAGLDMLSAVADVTNEELAVAAGKARHRRDHSLSSAFGSLGSFDFKRMLNNSSPTSLQKSSSSDSTKIATPQDARGPPQAAPAPAPRTVTESGGANASQQVSHHPGQPLHTAMLSTALQSPPRSRYGHPFRPIAPKRTPTPPTPMTSNITQQQGPAPTAVALAADDQEPIPINGSGAIGGVDSPSKKKKGHHRYLSSFSANFAEFIGAATSDEVNAIAAEEAQQTPGHAPHHRTASSATKLLMQLEENIDANAVNFVSQPPPPPLPTTGAQAGEFAPPPAPTGGERVGQLVFPAPRPPAGMIPVNPNEMRQSNPPPIYTAPPAGAPVPLAPSPVAAPPEAASSVTYDTMPAPAPIAPAFDVREPLAKREDISERHQNGVVRTTVGWRGQTTVEPSPVKSVRPSEKVKPRATRSKKLPKEETGAGKGGGSKRVRRKCNVEGCPNRVVQGGLCISHGAKRKTCSHPGCDKNVKKAGLCSTHGPARKRCDAEGCSKVAVQGGRCITHGARKKLCSVDDCKKQSIINGMCKKHYDEICVHAGGRNVRRKSGSAAGKKGGATVEEQNHAPPPLPPASAIENVGVSDSASVKPTRKASGHRRGLSIFHDMTAVDSIIGTDADGNGQSAAASSNETQPQTPAAAPAPTSTIQTSTASSRRQSHHRGLSLFSDENVADAIITNNFKLGPIN